MSSARARPGWQPQPNRRRRCSASTRTRPSPPTLSKNWVTSTSTTVRSAWRPDGSCRPTAAPSPRAGAPSAPPGKPPGRRWASPVTRSVLAPRRSRIGLHGDAKVLAAGGVLWRGDARKAGAEREIAVVHRPKYGDWSLPKGKVDEGEQLVVT